jgi:hypothetical protein
MHVASDKRLKKKTSGTGIMQLSPSFIITIDVENNDDLIFIMSNTLLIFTILMSDTEKYNVRKYHVSL